jgi:hypothetical protein
MRFLLLTLCLWAGLALANPSDVFAQKLNEKASNGTGKIVDGEIQDTEGNFIGRINPDGKIRDRYNSQVGYFDKTGTIRNMSNEKIGSVDAGGVVKNKYNQVVGKVGADGTIYNAQGQAVGKAKGVSQQHAGAIFFYY